MAEMAMNFAAQELGNVKNLEENMQILRRKIELLNSREADVVTALQGAELVSGKKRKREVEDWLKKVDEKRTQFERLGQQVRQTRPYNIIPLRRLAKQVVNEIDEVAELVEQGRFPEGVVLDTFVKESMPLVVTSRVKGLAFEHNFKNIWAWLMDDEVLSIGIYGMGGVGKTTLAMHLHDNLLHEHRFSNCVYWVTVSQEFNNYKLQNGIAQSMNIDFTGENDEKKRAAILFQALSKRKKFVIILDDVWNQFDVEKIGIPLGLDGCKLLITSRLADVCRRIACQKLIKVEALSELEAWELFREELGCTMLAPEIEETAQKVAKRCGGLPLGIITMARSMRGVTDIHEWKDALEELKESSMGQDNMESEVLPILLCSFYRLGNPKLQRCFLYCSLYPEDHEIPRDELINKFIMEELMDRRSSRQAEFDQGHAILNKLENGCLLLRSQHSEGVKMHDLIREMALWITREENPRFMVKAGLQLKEIPAGQDWKEDLDKVSLMRNKITDIPPGTSPNCPSLSTLTLSENPFFMIPDSFFMHMCSLKILDLSETNIVQLPNSILDLENLKALLLRDCRRLISLPSLKKLKELRQLDLSYTNIKEVVQGMESLANLKCLNLYYVSLEMIPSGTLRRLSHLQRLILPVGMAVAVEEVEGLRHLEEFQGTFYGMCDLNRFIKSQHCHGQLSFYDIGVGNIYPSQIFFEDSGLKLTCKKATIRKCDLQEIGKADEVMLPRDIEVLYIKHCEDIECIMRLSSDEELMAEREQERRWLPLENLEYLYLDELPNFRGIIKWEPGAVRVPPPGTLCHLRELEISRCKSIKKLLPRGLVDNLQNLEELRVDSCEQMEEIIGEDEGKYIGTDVTLPRLRCLTLQNLPELISIGISTKSVPGAGVPPPSTRTLSCLRELAIIKCKKIKKLLPRVLVDNLKNLEELRVCSCEQMEEIIGEDEGKYSGTDVNLPRLRHLTLQDLPELKSISMSTSICDSIENIWIQKCNKLKKVPLFHGQPSAPPALKAIFILEREREWWDSLEWDHFDMSNVLQPFVNLRDHL
ncbi:hypothetical protein Pfo_013637 [Paulownia fortunei]|nr:hypothetical protein Pfo_013637 [Paulownia fortunei]